MSFKSLRTLEFLSNVCHFLVYSFLLQFTDSGASNVRDELQTFQGELQAPGKILKSNLCETTHIRCHLGRLELRRTD